MDIHQLFHIRQISRRRGHDRYARAGQGDLGGGGVLEHHVRVPRLAAEGQYVVKGHERALKLMHAVGVVPHQQKVRRRGLQCGNAPHRFGGVHDAVRIGVFGYAPHTLHGGIPYQRLYQVHVRAGGRHGHGDHLRAEGLCDLEMPVIAGSRAQPFYLVQSAPGCFAVEQSVGICLGDGVIHQRQRGAAADETFLCPAAQQLREQFFSTGQTGQLPVVADIHAVRLALHRVVQYGQYVGYGVQLRLAGLAPRHIQRQPQFTQGVEPGGDLCVFPAQCLRGEGTISGRHDRHSLLIVYVLHRTVRGQRRCHCGADRNQAHG